MTYMNPIVKNKPYKYSWLDKPPVVPTGMALVLYPHDSREHCNVYLQEDIVYPGEIKKRHFDRLAHITLQAFEFQHKFRFSFSDGINQWVDISYKFIVSVKPDKEAIKIILKNNVTDISEPVLERLDTFTLDKSYKSIELLSLENEALRKIRELLSRLTYLKIQVSQIAFSIDDISKKQFENDKADKLRQVDIEATQKRLARDKEEAVIQQKEVEITREKVERERQYHQVKLETERIYQLQQAENIAAIAQAHRKNIELFGLGTQTAIDPTYQTHIDSQQAQKELERENEMKNLEVIKQRILLIKEMVEAGVMDDMMAGQMTQQLLLGGIQATRPQVSSSSSDVGIEDEHVINISEDGKDDI